MTITENVFEVGYVIVRSIRKGLPDEWLWMGNVVYDTPESAGETLMNLNAMLLDSGQDDQEPYRVVKRTYSLKFEEIN